MSKFGALMFARVGVIRQSMNKLARLNFHQKLAVSVGMGLNFAMAVHGVSTGALSPGDLVFLNILMSQVFGPLFNLGHMYRLWQESFFELNELLMLLSREQKIKDKPHAVDFQIQRGAIKFLNVGYNYSTDVDSRDGIKKLSGNSPINPPQMPQNKPSPIQRLISVLDKLIVFDRNANKEPAEVPKKNPENAQPKMNTEERPNIVEKEAEFKIEGFNLEIESNQVVLITGASGVGKSTLMSLMIRLIEPEEGQITIDGKDILDMTLKSLREGVSFCPQSHYFFNDSFVNNIKFAHIDRYFDMDQPVDPKMQGDEYITFSQVSHRVDPELGVEPEIYDLVREFNLLETVEAHEERWDFVIGDNGDKLSGGQKQRVNLVRSLLKDAAIYIFDEPSNFLDAFNRQVL